MAINVVGLMHAGLRIAPGDKDVQDAVEFYGDLLGLQMDEKRPQIPGIPGFWAYVGDRAVGQQIHIMGAEGSSPVSRSSKHDPTRNHIALGSRISRKPKPNSKAGASNSGSTRGWWARRRIKSFSKTASAT